MLHASKRKCRFYSNRDTEKGSVPFNEDIYEDRQLEITSFLPISIEGQIAAMDKVLA